MAQNLTEIQQKMFKVKFWKITVLLKKTKFFNRKYLFELQAAASAHAEMMQSESAAMVSSSSKESKMAATSMTSEAKMASSSSSKMAASETKITAASSEAKVARRSSFSRVSTSSEMAAQEAVEYHQKHVRASSQERYLSR